MMCVSMHLLILEGHLRMTLYLSREHAFLLLLASFFERQNTHDRPRLPFDIVKKCKFVELAE